MKIMNFSEANCHRCYKCVRSCKVKAIKIEGDQAHIVSDRCIACGQCFSSCPQNARNIHSDLGFVKKLIQSGSRVGLSLAPSFRGFFSQSDRFIGALRKIGFTNIEETAVGADITTELYKDYINKNKMDTYITTCCPSVILLIERYYPGLIPYLLPFTSPMITHGMMMKERSGRDPVVFIGPCIAKKCESLSKKYDQAVDAVLTFDEISSWLQEEGIDYLHMEEDRADLMGSATGKSYPVVGGILEGMRDTLRENNLIHMRVDGVDESMEIFDEILSGNLRGVCVEVSACNKSCLGGPSGSTVSSSTFSRVRRLKEYLVTREICQGESSVFSSLDFTTTFSSKVFTDPLPSEGELREILHSIGKDTPEEELNCGGCGYDTCRDKALSIYRGMSHGDMCVHYVKSRNERISNEIFENSPNGILILDHEGRIIESNMAFSRFFGISPQELKKSYPSDFQVLKPLEEFTGSRRRILWERVHLPQVELHMGLSMIPMEERDAFILFLTDITSEEVKKKEIRALQDRTLAITQEVVVKQMRVAQEIASLLGETTAETKVALNRVRDVFSPEEDRL